MKLTIKYSIAIFIFLLIAVQSNAAVQVQQPAENTVLIIKKTNGKPYKKRHVFEKGESIVFKIKGEEVSQKGTITNFQNDTIFITTKNGNTQKVAIDDLLTIRRKYNLRSFISLGLMLGLLVPIFFINFSIFLILSGRSDGIDYVTLVLISLPPILIGLLGRLGFRKFTNYKLEDKWKAEIVEGE